MKKQILVIFLFWIWIYYLHWYYTFEKNITESFFPKNNVSYYLQLTLDSKEAYEEFVELIVLHKLEN